MVTTGAPAAGTQLALRHFRCCSSLWRKLRRAVLAQRVFVQGLQIGSDELHRQRVCIRFERDKTVGAAGKERAFRAPVNPSPSPVTPSLVRTLQNTQFTLPTLTMTVFRPVIFRLRGLAFATVSCASEICGRASSAPLGERKGSSVHFISGSDVSSVTTTS